MNRKWNIVFVMNIMLNATERKGKIIFMNSLIGVNYVQSKSICKQKKTHSIPKRKMKPNTRTKKNPYIIFGELYDGIHDKVDLNWILRSSLKNKDIISFLVGSLFVRFQVGRTLFTSFLKFLYCRSVYCSPFFCPQVSVYCTAIIVRKKVLPNSLKF